MNAAGAPTPCPKPTVIGVLNNIAEIGTAPVTVRNSTPPSATACLGSLGDLIALRDVIVLRGHSPCRLPSPRSSDCAMGSSGEPGSPADLIAFASNGEMLAKSKQFWNPGKTQFWIDSGVPLVIDRREGYFIYGVEGKRLIDVHLNGGTYNLGHRNPEVVTARGPAALRSRGSAHDRRDGGGKRLVHAPARRDTEWRVP
jgi:hypothetical protein